MNAEKVTRLVKGVRRQMPRLGTRKLYKELQEDFQEAGIRLGRDAMFRILRCAGLLIRPKRRYVQTTDSRHWMRKYPNLIKGLRVTRSEQLWVSDITFIATDEGFGYLSLVTDAYSKKIMGYAFRRDLTKEGPLEALRMALLQRQYREQPLIHHSDRGYQYCSKSYVELLTRHGVAISMTEDGSPYDNAIAERVNGTLKNEFLLQDSFQTFDLAVMVTHEAITIYNSRRPHLSLDMQTPDHVHQTNDHRKILWTKNRCRHAYNGLSQINTN
jgi:transposase InsO family protein